MSLAYDLITSSAGPALGFADKLQREHMGAAAALARALGTGIRGLMMAARPGGGGLERRARRRASPRPRQDGTRLNPAAPCQRLLRCEGRYCLNGRHTEERRAGAS